MKVGGQTYRYFNLKKAEAAGLGDLSELPYSLKVLLENLLRNEDGVAVKKEDVLAMGQWLDLRKSDKEISYYPARVLMQDFTGVPAVVDLAAMRDAMKSLGGDAQQINPLTPVDLVIDHSVSVDAYGTATAFEENVDIEFQRNRERYEFLKWGQNSFQNFRVVPPGTGICHQVNLEYLAKVVWTIESDDQGAPWAYCDTLVGTDSHTTMVNGLAVLGWGVGGIEAEAAMLGQPVTMLIPEVIGFKLTNKLVEGTTATDLVLTVVQMLRQKGVVGKFVEFFGPGLDALTLADRATIANMAPEYGATCGFFPIDQETLNYLHFTGRPQNEIDLVEQYAKEQGLWRDDTKTPSFTDILELDMSTVQTCVAGPKRPQDRIELDGTASAFDRDLKELFKVEDIDKNVAVQDEEYCIAQGDVVIAAITSCTNTSNPSVMIAAGLVAQKAVAKGLHVKPWVKTSLAPGSQVVSEYLEKAGLQTSLNQLGFDIVGYGCTTCIGNSGPLKESITQAIKEGDLVATSVLSGNRNFEGRIGPDVKANFLASPPLVVAYAIAGTMKIDLSKDSIGMDVDGKPVYLKDIWPSNQEIQAAMTANLNREMFQSKYADVFNGTDKWKEIAVSTSETFDWNNQSTYVQNPPYFSGMNKDSSHQGNIEGAKVLALLGDSVTTDHISPAGAIKSDSPAGLYLQKHGVGLKDFNSYGSRRGNHEVMMRGTFANIRIRNEMVPDVEGGFTKYLPTGETQSIYDASMAYQKDQTPLVVIAGKEYGTGSSRDWAAKGTRLLGVRAVIAESFERIHRSNLIGMGVLPLQFEKGVGRKTLGLDGSESFTLTGIGPELNPRAKVQCDIHFTDGRKEKIELICRIDTGNELEYYHNEGILHYVLRNLNQ
jgi:aconitate hydratase